MPDSRTPTAPDAGDDPGPVLALDTTGSLGSVAVVSGPARRDGGEVVETFEPANRHAANLLPAIRRALDRAAVGEGTLVLLAATRGPGSFTGLRVGLATLHGLALASGTRAVGVSSLAAAAFADLSAGASARRRLAVVDALRGEVFAAVHEAADPARAVAGPRRLSPERTGAFARALGVDRICGPGVARYREAIAAGAGGIELAAEPRPLAPAVARLGFAAWRRGESDLEPLYLRDPDIHGRP